MTNHQFKKIVWHYFRKAGRDLPWRKTANPYKILVSEIMLQQTQVDRVIPKYRQWLLLFPTARSLAEAPLSKTLTAWRGLGYNRRALALQRAARLISNSKTFPREYEKILALPGVGPYTANAIMAFAFNQPVVMIETNIRTVFIHHFFTKTARVTDSDILPLIEVTLDRTQPREWYWALMDYGAHLKKEIGNASRQSAHYAKQSRFSGSDRQLRGAVLQYVSTAPITITLLRRHLATAKLNPEPERLKKILGALVVEGFLTRRGQHITLVQ